LTGAGAALHNVRVSRRAEKPPDSALQSAIAPRNFTVGLYERVRGLAGPPAYSSRKRRIEDIEDELVLAVKLLELPADGSGLVWEDLLTTLMKRRFTLLNELIAAHNRFYPIEANLPMDYRAGHRPERLVAAPRGDVGRAGGARA
jgi:hypothetical protein